MQTSIDTWYKDHFVLSTDKSLLQRERIHEFLSSKAYWSLDIPLEIVERAIDNSLCFGVYDKAKENNPQVGFTRVVTDCATFAWICDVYIEEGYRARGLSKWMMECVMSHQALHGLRRICLATKDAHALYQKYGFEITRNPENWLEIKDNDLYR